MVWDGAVKRCDKHLPSTELAEMGNDENLWALTFLSHFPSPTSTPPRTGTINLVQGVWICWLDPILVH